MLGRTDRLRILCLRLGLSFDDFLTIFAGPRDKQKLREQVRAWWEHKQQPTKEAGRLIELLSTAAQKKNINLDVGKLWEADLTAGEFAAGCDLSIHAAAAVVSPVCQRGIFELVDSILHLELFHNQYKQRREFFDGTLQERTGSYFVYRIHSSERSLCQEIVVIYPSPVRFFWTAKYMQYAEGNRRREISLSLFPTDRWTHALGSYTDAMPNGGSRSSMLHAILVNAPYRRSTFTGILLDVADNESGTAAQRILLRKISNRTIDDLDRYVGVQKENTVRMQRFRDFLQIDRQDDRAMLTADQARITRMLEASLGRAV